MTRLRLMSYNVGGLRGDLAAMAALVRSQKPDVVAVQEAPRRLRWRSRCADLARRFGLVYAAGGLPGLGNLLLVDLRVRVHDTWCLRYPLTPGRHLRGAALARCSVGGSTFVVAGTHLATDPAERPAQAAILAKALAEVDRPLILAADVNEEPGGAAWARSPRAGWTWPGPRRRVGRPPPRFRPSGRPGASTPSSSTGASR